jgi:hypothetical protein
MFLVAISAYLVSIFTAKRTLLELKQRSASLTFRTKNLQEQLARYFLIYLWIKYPLELY